MDNAQLQKHLKTKDKKLNAEIKKSQFIQKQSQRYSKLNNLFQEERAGYLVAEENEQTLQFRQDQLKSLIPIQNAEKIFDLELEWGQYKLDYSRNGNALALGSSKGHIALMNWKKKQLQCEFNVKDKIYDIKFLQNNNTFATAQQKHVYIYDQSGVELHKLKSHLEPSHLEYLPYHFLLVSSSRLGFLKYHDVSTGQIVAEYRTKVRDPCSMRQDPHNGIICIGDNKGQVTMYSPNTPEPLISVLCHKANVSSINIHQSGHYFVTTSNDGTWKVWDNRTYKMVNDYWSPSLIKHSDMSQKGILAFSMGRQLQFWKDWHLEKQQNPYMKHVSFKNKSITDVQFVPYEDFVGLGLDGGYQSILVPGSGEANIDSYEANPFRSGKQESEDLVHKLLEKLPSTTITLNPNIIGTVDRASKEVIEKEEKEEEKERLAKIVKKKKNKMRGKQKTGRKENAKEFEKEKKEFEKRNQHVSMLVRQKNAEKTKKIQQLNALKQLDEAIDFDPLQLIAKSKKIKKQQESEQL